MCFLNRFKIGKHSLTGAPSFGLPAFQSRTFPEFAKHLTFRGQVRLQIAARGGDRTVTQVVSNGGQLNARLEQSHCATMAKYVRVNRPQRQRGVSFSRKVIVMAKHICNTVTGEWLAARIQKDVPFH